MIELSDLEKRIARLTSRALSGPLTPELAAEIESVLAEGYIAALQADARSHRLRAQVDALVDVDIEVPRMAEEMRRLGDERRRVEQSAYRLRERLAELKPLVARAAGPRSHSG